MADTVHINSLMAMAARIRAVGSDQVKLDALIAAIENEARLLRDGPDPEPLTEDEKAVLFDPITGDRIRVVQPGDVRGHRVRAQAQIAASKKVADEVRANRAKGPLDVEVRPEPFRIGGPATPEELRVERGLAADQRAAVTAGQISAKPSPPSPIVQPVPPVNSGIQAGQASQSQLNERQQATSPQPVFPPPGRPIPPAPTPPVRHDPHTDDI